MWGLVLLCLPVTSFRFFPFLGKDTMVRPLAYYPLAVLVILLVIRLFKREIEFKIKGSLVLLGLFLVSAIASTAFGWAYGQTAMHGQDFLGRSIRAWVTLAGGMVFFLCTLLMNQTENDLRRSFKWLYAGLALSILWGGVQMVSYLTGFPPRTSLNEVQLSFSIRKLLAKQRAAGFAFEPSWLANQIATIYFPWLLAALLTGYKVFRQKWADYLLLAGMVALLICTFSRGGILMAIAASILVFLLTQRARMKAWMGWLILPFRKVSVERRVSSVALRMGLLIGVVAVISGMVYVLSTSKYFASIWQTQKSSLVEYAVDIYAGPRLAYASAGWGVYLDHPLTGVGLGASGLTLFDHLPDWSITTISEISRQLTTHAWLYPNPKNLYIRLLAETGIIGFLIYLTFWLSILAAAIRMVKSTDKLHKFMGTAGVYLWLVLILFNFTQDSFIDPNQWLGLGMFLGLATATSIKGSVNTEASLVN